jgi:hypothetical protein
MEISEIPQLPDREQRFEELFVDTYGIWEELSGMGVYFDDCLTFPFEAIWRDEEGSGYQETATVIGIGPESNRDALTLKVQRSRGVLDVPAYQITPIELGVNAIVLDDYRHWFRTTWPPEDDSE